MSNTSVRPETSVRPRVTEPPAHVRLRAVPILATLLTLIVAGVLAWVAWQTYMTAPWTRDGTVRAYVVSMAPEVAGRVIKVPVHDNQLVRKGDVLFEVDPADYAIAVQQAQAAVEQARANADNAQTQAQRRLRLNTLETSQEETETYTSNARATEASYQQAVANLARARLNLQRTTIRSPVNGSVTNLLLQQGDYVAAGQNVISVVNTDSFWVDGYFEETSLDAIKVGDAATVKLMRSSTPLRGRVASIARGIVVANATSGQGGLANVNPVFTWIRLAQRVPVRIELDQVPAGVQLVAGETASIQIDRSR
ncbi:MAG TPA: HlyD family secretion protein [Rhodopila sp.]|jgi:multidrug resistance efflux pump|nr:HlyD family secretion protein [Rhodopila sp.]